MTKKDKIIHMLYYDNKEYMLMANHLRTGEVKLEDIKKEYRKKIKEYSRLLQAISNKGYYLGEGISDADIYLSSIREGIKVYLEEN